MMVRNKMKNLTIVTILLAVLFFLPSCLTTKGTDTGNPNRHQSNADPIKQTLREIVCDKIIFCYPGAISQLSCNSELGKITNIDTVLGLTPDTYQNFNETINAMYKNESLINLTARNNCETEIRALTCDSSEVVNSYDAETPLDLSFAFNIFPPTEASCPDIFAAQ